MNNDIFNLLSAHLKQSIARTITLAEELGESTVSPAHMWLTLASERGSVATEILRKANVDADKILQKLRDDVPKKNTLLNLRRKKELPVRLSDDIISVLTKSFSIAAEYEH